MAHVGLGAGTTQDNMPSARDWGRAIIALPQRSLTLALSGESSPYHEHSYTSLPVCERVARYFGLVRGYLQ